MKTTHLKTLIAHGLGGRPSSNHMYACEIQMKDANKRFRLRCENVFKVLEPKFTFLLDDIPTRFNSNAKDTIYFLAQLADVITRDATNSLSPWEAKNKCSSTGIPWQDAFKSTCNDLLKWQTTYNT